MQSISPGLVRTEFRGRCANVEDLEQSKKDYDKLCDGVGQTLIRNTLLSVKLNPLLPPYYLHTLWL